MNINNNNNGNDNDNDNRTAIQNVTANKQVR
jgi:hypothetical protein